MKAVAFYLPQFHVIPENEVVYGEGFTEWDNVRNAQALFPEHYQPHIPHPLLGYYDLLDEKALTLQHELARSNGVSAFCYYYYNMNGRLLLEKPLQIINSSRHISNEFCLCWDHNHWYDNHREVTDRKIPFVWQQYCAEGARHVVRDCMQYFTNPRYIRIEGKPLFLVFAPERLPDPRMYADIWREEAHRMGLSGLYLAGVESYMGAHPDNYGFDCMVEFAPNWHPKNHVSIPGGKPVRIDYPATVKDMLAKSEPDYHRLRCAFPSWDNTPRRGRKGIAAVGTSPVIFRAMLQMMAEYTRRVLPDTHQYLFINAWNEWGEGCHLEPDMLHGFDFLHVVRDVMGDFTSRA